MVLKLADKSFNSKDSLRLVLQGEGGSGKSYLVLEFMKKMLEFCNMRGITCAFSNSSANTIEGVTINRLAGASRNRTGSHSFLSPDPLKESKYHLIFTPRIGA